MKRFLPLLAAAMLSGHHLQAQCVAITGCPAASLEVCDLSDNDTKLWNAAYWWDGVIGSHDLAEGSAELSVTAKDVCFSGGLIFRYQLFLDIDGDGIMETVVDSKTPPAQAGGLYFGNAANPNFSGGTFRTFDHRPVAPWLKYSFGMQVSGAGNTKTARVRWRTTGTPPGNVAPQLPYGTHKIKWIVEDANGGNQQVCEHTFIVKDCKSPTVNCFDLSVNLMPTTGMITIWAMDFLWYAEDNVTPPNLLKFGIRKAGSGTGFPVDANGNPVSSVTFDCDEIGTVAVELWTIDAAGNVSSCTSGITIQDNFSSCGNNNGFISICVQEYCSGMPMADGIGIGVTGSGPGIPPFTYTVLNNVGGCFDPSTNAIPLPANYTITPSKDDNPLNGVSSYDVALILAHLDGSQPFTQAWQYIAADVNKNNSVDSLDAVELNKLIIGIYNELPNNYSWRFIRGDYVFPPNPFSMPIPENVTVADILATSDSSFTFKAIKIGDLNCSAITNAIGQTEDRDEIRLVLKKPAVSPSRPNPTSGGSIIPLALPVQATVHFNLFDLSGKSAYSFENQIDAGEHALQVPADAMPNAGWYGWQILVNGEVFTGKILRN